jgi:hypothetical protein
MDNVEYTMHILFKFSNVALTGVTVGSQLDPYYGNCEYYIYTKSATSADYPRISFAQSGIGLNTLFEIYMDMGIGGNSSW